jgi:multicomponent Na+:H+ antiporter subunit G
MSVLLIVVAALYLVGLFFNLTAALGIIRMPDIYCRLHSSSKNTTLGSSLIILGLALREAMAGAWPAVAKILFVGLLLLVVTPIGSHALARAAYWQGIPLWEGSVVDQYSTEGVTSGD